MNRFSDIDFSLEKLPPVYGYRSEKLGSIEKALEPIHTQIDELAYYLKIAKQYCHFPSEHGLTHDESAAVYIGLMQKYPPIFFFSMFQVFIETKYD